MVVLKRVAVLAMLALVAGCAYDAPGEDDYQLGDVTAHYCESTDQVVRAAGRLLAAQAGLTLPDLCRAHALVNGGVEQYEEEI
ncbi:hypothetical protein ACT3R7_11735 [Halomonas sp. AOP43-A1-21]